MEKRKIYGLLMVTVFLALGAALLLFRFWDGNEGVQMEVEALERTERGIAPETGFSLTATSALKEEELRELLEMEPDMGGRRRWRRRQRPSAGGFSRYCFLSARECGSGWKGNGRNRLAG